MSAPAHPEADPGLLSLSLEVRVGKTALWRESGGPTQTTGTAAVADLTAPRRISNTLTRFIRLICQNRCLWGSLQQVRKLVVNRMRQRATWMWQKVVRPSLLMERSWLCQRSAAVAAGCGVLQSVSQGASRPPCEYTGCPVSQAVRVFMH